MFSQTKALENLKFGMEIPQSMEGVTEGVSIFLLLSFPRGGAPNEHDWRFWDLFSTKDSGPTCGKS